MKIIHSTSHAQVVVCNLQRRKCICTKASPGLISLDGSGPSSNFAPWRIAFALSKPSISICLSLARRGKLMVKKSQPDSAFLIFSMTASNSPAVFDLASFVSSTDFSFSPWVIFREMTSFSAFSMLLFSSFTVSSNSATASFSEFVAFSKSLSMSSLIIPKIATMPVDSSVFPVYPPSHVVGGGGGASPAAAVNGCLAVFCANIKLFSL
mmetsp:Transcript_127330/g.254359  ORF Transcript_127330/g.254359 Transcript_127330/m.254359 type:complete len:209 (-) Transcript_127330:1707-2333(-)